MAGISYGGGFLRSGAHSRGGGAGSGGWKRYGGEAASAAGVAESARRGQGGSNPYMMPEQDTSSGDDEAYEAAMSALPGGSMGLKPDYSQRNQIKNQLDAAIKKAQSPWNQLLGLDGGDEIRGLTMRYHMADKEAKEAAAEARMSDPRYAVWGDSGNTTPEGQVIEKSTQGGRRLAEQITKIGTTGFEPRGEIEGVEGPPTEGELAYRRAAEAGIDLPAIQMERIDPVMDPRFVEQKKRQAFEEAMRVKNVEDAKIAREDAFGKSKQLEGIRTAGNIEESRASAKAHGDSSIRVAKETSDLPSRERASAGSLSPKDIQASVDNRYDTQYRALVTAGTPHEEADKKAKESAAAHRKELEASAGASRPAPPKLKKGDRKTFNGKLYEFVGDENANPNDRANWKLVDAGGAKK